MQLDLNVGNSVSVPSGQPIDLFFRDIEKWKKSLEISIFYYSVVYRKMEKSREMSVSPLHRKMEKGQDFFHFSPAWENRKKSGNFCLFVTRRKRKKVEKSPSLVARKNGKKVKNICCCRDEK